MSPNYSQQNALLCGIRAARYGRYDVIVTMDDDLQHPASEIAPVPAALGPDVDVVYGAPHNDHHGFPRDVTSRLTKLALASGMGADGKCRLSSHSPSRFVGRRRYGRANGDLIVTNDLSSRLIRLLMWVGLQEANQNRVGDALMRILTIRA